MLTEKDYCDYETSRELKELGFIAGLGEDDCGHCLYDDAWHDQVDRPLLYEVQKWLREEKQMVLHPAYLEGANVWICEICYKRERLGFGGYNQSYEEALSEGIKEAVKILKED